MKHTFSASALIALLVVLLLAVPTTAAAQSRAVARSVVPTSTATWGAVSTSAGGPATLGGQAQATVPGWSSSPDYFDVVNVGTVPLFEQRITVSTIALGWLGGDRDPSQTLIGCSKGAWVGNKCSGTQVQLVWIGNLDFIASIPLNPGERYTVRLSNKGTTPWTLVTTVNVAISEAQLYAPATSNN